MTAYHDIVGICVAPGAENLIKFVHADGAVAIRVKHAKDMDACG
jgi:hypothetical protein